MAILSSFPRLQGGEADQDAIHPVPDLFQRFPRAARLAFALCVAVDLILRLLPLSINSAFPVACSIIGFAVRLGCLALILLDLRAAKQQ